MAATSEPATPPPTTRPSGLANDTVIPPVLLRVLSESIGMNDPDSESVIVSHIDPRMSMYHHMNQADEL